MGEITGISWTHHTFNTHWGCTKISPGCTNCYADTLAHRWAYDIWGPKAERRFFLDVPGKVNKHWQEPLNWNKKALLAGQRRRVFCGSMMDWCEERPDLPQMEADRQRLFKLIDDTPWLDWLLLTKRPERIMALIPDSWKAQPRFNVWMGTSTENQKEADHRIPELLKVPAAIRFISAEPLLGPLDLWKFAGGEETFGTLYDHRYSYEYFQAFVQAFQDKTTTVTGPGVQYPGIDWVIVGGESGPGHRPMDIAWARSIRAQCVEEAGVAFFFKQGSQDWGPDFKKIETMPADLQVHEFPKNYYLPPQFSDGA